jgi:2,4-dienoyl-CoA reductase-like NADH-dependent reductase (Old Yellow Enzyme family)
MDVLFTPGKIGTLELPNRLVRSATAERMADDQGVPRPQLTDLYRELARGGVGLIITGHMYVHASGKAHPEMTGIYADELIPHLAELADAIHAAEGHVAVQINHGGMQASDASVEEAIAPSAVHRSARARASREMTAAEVDSIVDAFGHAARRAKEAGFDAVQIHGAHGYLVSQFLSPAINKRSDDWGSNLEGRMRFLRAVCQAVRDQVGPDYPVFIKLGVVDGIKGGLPLQEGLQVVAAAQSMGLDAIEISSGVGGGKLTSIRKDIKTPEDEAYFRHWAHAAQARTDLPIILVGGFRSRGVMEEVLASGDADLISLCRPLICEPDLPKRMRLGLQERSRCISANRCWAEQDREGIACKCPLDKSEA